MARYIDAEKLENLDIEMCAWARTEGNKEIESKWQYILQITREQPTVDVDTIVRREEDEKWSEPSYFYDEIKNSPETIKSKFPAPYGREADNFYIAYYDSGEPMYLGISSGMMSVGTIWIDPFHPEDIDKICKTLEEGGIFARSRRNEEKVKEDG